MYLLSHIFVVTIVLSYVNVNQLIVDCKQAYEFGGLWNEFFEMFIDGGVQFGNWFDHVLGWWAHRDDPNILFLKYEDMKKDLPCAVQQIAEFLGQDLSVEMIQRITEQTSFTAMSGDQERFDHHGTTWLSEIVWQIYFDGRVDMKPMGERVPFLENTKYINHNIKTKQDLHDFYLKHAPRFFKTHLQYHQVPMVDGVTKYFYVIRNPKDVAVSYYYHYKRFASYEFGAGLWDEFFEMFIDGGVQFGNWFDHVLGWWAHRDDPNIMFLKYEDMKKDLPCAVQQIAEFLGQDLSVEMIQRITEQTNFSAMSGDQERFDHDDEETILEIKFVRKGEVGDWRNYFTKEQNRRFDWTVREEDGWEWTGTTV
ncbi:hypothetical protein QZH41_008016 [Actinostola sp. cb2023]|nr:hypothetical protein QZH41_008016 [Actinostola sp. cb2023]